MFSKQLITERLFRGKRPLSRMALGASFSVGFIERACERSAVLAGWRTLDPQKCRDVKFNAFEGLKWCFVASAYTR